MATKTLLTQIRRLCEETHHNVRSIMKGKLRDSRTRKGRRKRKIKFQRYALYCEVLAAAKITVQEEFRCVYSGTMSQRRLAVCRNSCIHSSPSSLNEAEWSASDFDCWNARKTAPSLQYISGFHREAGELCALLGYYSASSVNLLPTFQDNLSVQNSRTKKSKLSRNVVRYYHSALRNIPEVHRYHCKFGWLALAVGLRRGGD